MSEAPRSKIPLRDALVLKPSNIEQADRALTS